jgi:hypothetical protein
MTMMLLLAVLLAGELPISQPDVIPMGRGSVLMAVPDITAGDGFLVTWAEYQGAPNYFATVRARTYDADGTPRQAVPVTIGQAGQSQWPSAFWNGSEFVVLYSIPPSRLPVMVDQPVIFATRIRPDGSIAGSRALVSGRPGPVILDVAFDGVHALAAIAGSNGGRLLRLDRDGRLLEDTPISETPGAIAARPSGGFFVLPASLGGKVAAGGDRFAALDARSDGLVARILNSEGNEIESFPLADDAVSTSIAWDGSAWIAVYTTGDRALCTARFTRQSNLVNSCGAAGTAHVAAVGAGPGGIFRVWSNDGQVMTDGGLATTMISSASNPDAVVDDAGLLAAWSETTTSGRSVRIGGLFHDGRTRPEHGVPGGASQHSASLSRSHSQTLLVWNESPGSFATRIGGDGAPVDAPVRVGNGFRHSVASHGDGWVVAWLSIRTVEITRLTRELQVAATESFARTLIQQSEPAVAATGSGYLVAWPEHGLDPQYAVFVEPLDADGRRTSSGKLVPATRSVHSLAIQCGPRTCLAAGYDGQGLWTIVLRHDGTPVGSPRTFEGNVSSMPPAIKAEGDGSYRVYHGNLVTPLSSTGEPGVTRPWHSALVTHGDAITFGGRTTLVYERAGRIFAMPEPMPRMRSIRR